MTQQTDERARPWPSNPGPTEWLGLSLDRILADPKILAEKLKIAPEMMKDIIYLVAPAQGHD